MTGAALTSAANGLALGGASARNSSCIEHALRIVRGR